MTDQPIYGLVCAGGGAHGAYQVGVLNYIHEHFCDGERSPFRVFSGTSAGSLNTSFLGSRSFDARTSRLILEQMWLDFHVPAYHGNVVKNSILTLLKEWSKPPSRRREAWSLLDPQPLRDVVSRGFVRDDFERAVREGTTLGLAVSATELHSSRLVWFQDGPAAAPWSTYAASAVEACLSVSHIQASCSVPLVFPPVRIGDHYFADGGVANKHPFGPAINMGATRILSIATDQPLAPALPSDPSKDKPRFADVLRMLLLQLSHDYAPDRAFDLDMVNYFRERAGGKEPAPHAHIMRETSVELAHYRPVEIHLFAPTRRIGVTEILNPDLFDKALDARSTVLLFHREFIRPLIDLGYADARAKHAELATFLDAARPQDLSPFGAADADADEEPDA